MDTRTENILNAVIESFIKNNTPVSSTWLYEKYNFGIKPAMIRHELEGLAEAGYLEQPHHSAGRIPSDKAYEIFVSRILEDDHESDLNTSFSKIFKKSDWPEFISAFSDHLGILAALEEETKERVYKSGLETLLDCLNWENQNDIKKIIRDFEGLDEKIGNLKQKIRNNAPLQIFIGRKSPITESQDLAVIAQRCSIDGENILLIAIGPKRMNYKKVVKTFRDIKNIND